MYLKVKATISTHKKKRKKKLISLHFLVTTPSRNPLTKFNSKKKKKKRKEDATAELSAINRMTHNAGVWTFEG